MLLSILILAEENNNNYNFIFRSEDGRYYLTEESVIDLANYIKKLQDLNENYKKQIENLKAQIDNLEKQILNLEKQVEVLENENKKLQQELEIEKMKKYAWTVVTVISIGTAVFLFLK